MKETKTETDEGERTGDAANKEKPQTDKKKSIPLISQKITSSNSEEKYAKIKLKKLKGTNSTEIRFLLG